MNDGMPAHFSPRRDGMQFFLLWVGCALVGWIAGRVVSFFVFRSAGPSSWLQWYWISAIPALAVGLFQGWLLFKPGPRLALWAILPALYFVVPYFTVPNSGGLAYVTYAGFFSLFVIVVASILLTGVRRRPWLWLFIQLGLLVANQLSVFLIYWNGSGSPFDRLASRLNDLLGLGSHFTISGAALSQAGMQGIWLMGIILSAVALAWWMPPLPLNPGAVGASTAHPPMDLAPQESPESTTLSS
jgi:hypothetical protein